MAAQDANKDLGDQVTSEDVFEIEEKIGETVPAEGIPLTDTSSDETTLADKDPSGTLDETVGATLDDPINEQDFTEEIPADSAPSSDADISGKVEPIPIQSTPVEVDTPSIIPQSESTYQNEGKSMTDQPTTAPIADVKQVGDSGIYTINPADTWPPPIFVRPDASPRERYYIEHRWHSQWKYYDKSASDSKKVYYRLQWRVVIGSLFIPALVSLNSTIARFINDLAIFGTADPGTETMIRIGVDAITVFVSLVVAGSAAIESLYKYGENWSSYRSAAEELQAEKNFFDMRAGPYEGTQNPFATFVTRVEGIIANQNGKYFQSVQTQIAKQSENNENLVESFLAGDDDGTPQNRNGSETSVTEAPQSVG